MRDKRDTILMSGGVTHLWIETILFLAKKRKKIQVLG
nr:MAG TPA: hypothetical protein [Caudoviricetes sp.]